MTRVSRIVVLAVLSLALGCKFPELPLVDEDGALIDANSQDAPTTFQLTIEIDDASSGTGTVVVQPDGFSCATGICNRTYPAGTSLEITVAGTTSMDVPSISGDCSTTACTLPPLAADVTIQVRFDRLECVPNTETCTSGLYTQCGPTGSFVEHVIPNGGGVATPSTLTMNQYPCPMGCSSIEPRCADIDTENAVQTTLDSAAVSPLGLDIVIPSLGAPDGELIVNTDAFDAVAGELRFNDTSGFTIVIPAEQVTQEPGAPRVLVLKTRTFTLRPGTTLRLEGAPAIAIVAQFDILIGGRLDLSALRDGGLLIGGGPGSLSATAACGGKYVNGVSGGGSNGCLAGNGSNGAMRGDLLSLSPSVVVGGCGGGYSGQAIDFYAGGGGGLMLASRTKITLADGALIDLSGAGGTAGPNRAYGGGSGGRLVVQSPSLVVEQGAVVAGRGGSGGAANSSMGAHGSEGPTVGTEPALGATCSGCGVGGDGGFEADCSDNGTGSGTALGGGGGAIGRMNSYTRTGVTSAPFGSMRITLNQYTLMPR